jgi:hypothetical protein
MSLVPPKDKQEEVTWKKSKDNLLLNIAGSSEASTTGMPWFMIIGRGCIGIDEVRRYHLLSQYKLFFSYRKAYQHFISIGRSR